MTLALILEDFDTAPASPSPREDDLPRDEGRLASYDDGYAAGWEDGTAAVRSETDAAERAVLAQLQDLSFTFQEARAHVMRAVAPMVQAILCRAVPETLHATLGERLRVEINEMIDANAPAPVTLSVAPEREARLAEVLAGVPGLPVTLATDERLGPDALQLGLGEAGRRIDLGTLDAILNDAFAALDIHNEKVLSHG